MVPVFYLIGSVLVRATAKKVMQELAKRGAKRIAASQAAKMKESPINVTMNNLDKVVRNLSRAPKSGPKRFEGTLNKGKPPTIRKPMQLKPKPRKDNAPKKSSDASTAPTVFKNAPKGGTRRRPGDDAKDITPSNIAVKPSTKPKDPVKPSKPTTKFNPKSFVRTTGSATLLGGPQVARSEDTTTRASNKAKIKSSGESKIKPTTVSEDSLPSYSGGMRIPILKVPEKVISEVKIKTKSDKPSNKKKEAPKKDANKKKEAPKKDANKKKELSSFGKAFKTARAKGKGTIFTHNNKKYVAITQDDLKKMKMTFNEYLKKKKKK